MYPVSNAYKNAIVAKDRETYIAGTITLADNTVISITNSKIKQGSLYYTNQCVSDDGFSLGHTHRGKQGITIYDDMTNYRAFQGAKIELIYYLKISPTDYEGVPLGIFEVVEATRPTATTIKLVGYDNMAKFDVEYPLSIDDRYSMRTPFERLKDICVALGVELWDDDVNVQFELSDMPNGTQKHVLVWSPEIITARDYLDYLCQLLCGFATIDRLGRLSIVCWKWKHTITGYAIPDTLRKKSTFNDTILKYSAVNMSVSFTEGADGEFVKNIIAPEVPTGAGEVLSLYTNALIRATLYNKAQTVLDNIASVMTNTDPSNGTVMRWTPCDIQYTGDPALDLGDWVTYTGYTAGDGIEVPIHKIDWKYRGWQRLETLGENKKSERENNANRAKQEELAMVIKSGVGAKGTGKNAEIFNDYENNIASGNYSHAVGQDARATGGRSVALGGNGAEAIGYQSAAIGGNYTQASGDDSVAMGGGKAMGDSSFAVGSSCEAKGRGSVALGNSNITNVAHSFAVGYYNIAGVLGDYGDSSIAMGYRNKAAGTRAIAMGYMCEAGSHAIAMGDSCKATGGRSVALGGNHTASGGYSAVLGGSNNSAKKSGAVCIGGASCNADGDYSAVIGGASNTTSGVYSAVVGGYNNTASGTNAVAMGEEVTAKGSNQLVLGKYNVEDTVNKYAVVVGGGGGTSTRKNIFTVDWAGNVECTGTVNSTGNIYSPAETKTNQKWLDGKPIYRKLFEVPNTDLTAGTTQIALDVLNVETITNLHATIEYTVSTSLINVNSYWCSDLIPISTSQIIKIECVDGNLEILKQNDMSVDYENLKITIEYTKTTD